MRKKDSTATVLVVDDESSIRESLRMILEYEGYRVDEAASGTKAQGVAHADRRLPGSGFQVLARLFQDAIDPGASVHLVLLDALAVNTD